MKLHSCNSWLNHLLDKHEARSGKERAETLRPDLFVNVFEFEKLNTHIKALINKGALKPHFGRHVRRNIIEKVSIIDSNHIYELLDRVPSSLSSKDAITKLKEHAQPWEDFVLSEIENAWSKNKAWQNIYIIDHELLLPIQKLAQALHNGEHNDHDQRSFAAKTGDDSKLFEKKKGLIATYMYAGEPDAIDRLNNLFDNDKNRKISLPIIISGTFLLNNKEFPDILDYIGIPFHQMDTVTLSEKCKYVLTIENMTSFHRHVTEINHFNKNGFILYTGGQPASAFKRFYKILSASYAENVPFYHWSDIDQGGLEITNTLRLINPNLKLHLMTTDLVEKQGNASEKLNINLDTFKNTILENLACFLYQDNTKTLEQEKIDPCIPSL